jgi:hypothetical protein
MKISNSKIGGLKKGINFPFFILLPLITLKLYTMNYLGYEWENQVSILASRITLYLQKEIKLSFLSTATVNALGEYDTEKKEWTIKGFCLSRYNIPVEVAEDMVTDLKCIHVNRRQSSKHETCFAVCAYPSVMQAWYDIMTEGDISKYTADKLVLA